MLMLRAKFGAAGYGLFWMVIELLREQENYHFPLSYDALAIETATAVDIIEPFMQRCFELELLGTNGECFWAPSLLERMERMEELSGKRRDAANARHHPQRRSLQVVETDTELIGTNHATPENESSDPASIMQLHVKEPLSLGLGLVFRSKKNGEPPGREPPGAIPPEFDTPEIADELQNWLAFRRETKKPVRSWRTITEIFNRFSANPEALAPAIRHSIANGWQGIFLAPPSPALLSDKRTAASRAAAEAFLAEPEDASPFDFVRVYL